jgi:hypothetical protein
MVFTGKRMQMEIIMLSEVSQVKKDKAHTFSLICRIKESWPFMLVCVCTHTYIHMYKNILLSSLWEVEKEEENAMVGIEQWLNKLCNM